LKLKFFTYGKEQDIKRTIQFNYPNEKILTGTWAKTLLASVSLASSMGVVLGPAENRFSRKIFPK
jgi:hypothetical protein